MERSQNHSKTHVLGSFSFLKFALFEDVFLDQIIPRLLSVTWGY